MSVLTPQRRARIFAVGFVPIVMLVIILFVAAQLGLNVLAALTRVEPGEGGAPVVRTALFGLTLRERPATEADLVQEDEAVQLALMGVLAGTVLVMCGAGLICVAAATGRPASVLAWADQKLEAKRRAGPSAAAR